MERSNNAQAQRQVVSKLEQEHEAKHQQENGPDDELKDQSENDPRNVTISERSEESGHDKKSEQDIAQIVKSEGNFGNKPRSSVDKGEQNVLEEVAKTENHHKIDSRETKINEGNTQRPLPEQGPIRSSLDDIQKWPQPRTWQGHNPAGASRTSLPPSGASSIGSLCPPKTGRLSPGRSLEQLMLQPENIALPNAVTKKKPPPQSTFTQWVTRAQSTKGAKKESAPEQPAAAPEVLAYRMNINLLASYFSNLKNIAAEKSRQDWSSRIVLYDYVGSAQPHGLRRQEPWKSHASAPLYQEFYSTLTNIPENCVQRIVLVEDLTPMLIDLLGATFQIPPHVFEEHLDRSGYGNALESRGNNATWHTRSST
ncbi:hypothetical protein BU26DRAFT_595358 [Trematosphaeria pertusa]|uniref:Uncharacterized protein n=1 Tax=Trematosphaeria pertusa TaxID=390896 RepID=A0A6A6IFT4_9PLEO|nr:uncharacterized protein BU26DRAFT_595358 [Trematosphaeria pertusa]KAF2249444.1 hypothetical protein BU26DRAFT_595358 [Trematosphaeria pertusa]